MTPDPADNPTPLDASAGLPRRRPFFVRRWKTLAAVVVTPLIVGELVCRFVLGLGDPPLSVADARVEYRFAPGTYHRFGHTITYNDYSMRGPPITPHKADAAELRVLAVGDSILNGGVQTDDAELATTLLQDRLTKSLGRSVRVMNVSAGSWGPPNQAAYLDEFGWFDADALVYVASSHDGYDVPTFNPIVGVLPEFPDRRPWSALTEAFSRYTSLGRRLTAGSPPTPFKPEPADTPENEQACRAALDAIFGHAEAAGMPVVAVLNWERPEVDAGRLNPAAHVIAEAAVAHGVPLLQLGPEQTRSLKAGRDPYRDYIHPNAIGQALLADLIEPVLRDALTNRLHAPTMRPTPGQRPGSSPVSTTASASP